MPADRQLALKVTALGEKAVKVLRGATSHTNADELERCLYELSNSEASHLDALRKVEAMCGSKWLGDDHLAATSNSDWKQILTELKQAAGAAAKSVFRARANDSEGI